MKNDPIETLNRRKALRAELLDALDMIPTIAVQCSTHALLAIALEQIQQRTIDEQTSRRLLSNPAMARAAANNIGAPYPFHDRFPDGRAIPDLTETLVRLGPDTLNSVMDRAPPGKKWNPGWVTGKLLRIALSDAHPWLAEALRTNQWGPRTADMSRNRYDPQRQQASTMLWAFLENGKSDRTDDRSQQGGNPNPFHARFRNAAVDTINQIAMLGERGLIARDAIEKWIFSEIRNAAEADGKLTGRAWEAEGFPPGTRAPALCQTSLVLHAIHASATLISLLEHLQPKWTEVQKWRGQDNLAMALLPALMGEGERFPAPPDPGQICPAITNLADRLAEKILSDDRNHRMTFGSREKTPELLALCERFLEFRTAQDIKRGVERSSQDRDRPTENAQALQSPGKSTGPGEGESNPGIRKRGYNHIPNRTPGTGTA